MAQGYSIFWEELDQAVVGMGFDSLYSNLAEVGGLGVTTLRFHPMSEPFCVEFVLVSRTEAKWPCRIFF